MRASEATEEELLNRIAAIQAAAEILDDNHELSHGDRYAFLTVIQAETARLHALVRQMASLWELRGRNHRRRNALSSQLAGGPPQLLPSRRSQRFW